MKFSIEIHKRALKDIKDMPPSNMEKFKELINTLETNPFPKNKFDIKRLKGNDEIYRIRIGKFRIQYVILWDCRKIIIRKIKKSYQ